MAHREYQHNFIKQHAAASAAGHSNVLLVLPVGAGKTYTARLVVEQVLPKKRHDVWILEHRNELGYQFAEAFSGLGAVRILAGQKTPAPAQLRIAGRDTLSNRPIEPLYDCAFLIIDEAHVGVSQSYTKLLDRFKAAYRKVYVLLLTATPYRLDGKPLGQLASILIEPVTPLELFDAGIIMEPQVIGAATVELNGVAVVGGEYVAGELAERSKTLIGDVVKEAKNWTEGFPFLVRCTTIAHSQKVAERLCAAGFKARHLDGSTSAADRNEMLAMLSGGLIDCITVSKGGLLTEGWNPENDYKRLLLLPHLWSAAAGAEWQKLKKEEPSEEKALLRLLLHHQPPTYMPLSTLSDCAPTMSQCLYRQFEGRVCRTCGDSIQVKIDGEMHTFPAVPKRFARIISHSGNWQPQPKGHGFLRDHYGFSLQNGKKSKGGTASLGSVRYCPGCLSVWPGSRTHCACGAALSEPKAPPEDTTEELVVVPVGAMPQASHRSVVSYLANLWTWWSRNNEKRAALGKPPTKEGQVRHVYHSRAGRWPTDAELAEARAQAKV